MSYHQFKDKTGETYGTFEVFYIGRAWINKEGDAREAGWYWRAPLLPGCLLNGDPAGPFNSKDDAIFFGSKL